MGTLLIKETEDTPKIIMSNEKGEFSFQGKSYPEDAMSFYAPIKKWIKEYILDPKEETIISFNFDYLNTASTKSIMELLMHLGKVLAMNKKLLIVWYFRREDEDMKSVGKKFEALTQLPFEFKTY